VQNAVWWGRLYSHDIGNVTRQYWLFPKEYIK
jgi:hypothetical protein